MGLFGKKDQDEDMTDYEKPNKAGSGHRVLPAVAAALPAVGAAGALHRKKSESRSNSSLSS